MCPDSCVTHVPGLYQFCREKCGLTSSHQKRVFEKRWKPGSIKSGLSAAGGNFYGVAGTDAFSVLALHVLELDGRVMDVEAFP